MHNEIVIYQSEMLSSPIEVRVEAETVWLNRQQISLLFDRDVKTIGKHVNNASKEELKDIAVVAKFATTATDGKVYQVEHYNLDMILSVGYRVKSSRGVAFRIWANTVLKNYLLKGVALNHRIEILESKVNSLEIKNNEFDLIINTKLPPNQGIFYDGQLFDAHVFVAKIMKSAKKSILLFDNYIDETVLLQLSKREKGVKVVIYTKNNTKQLQLDLERFNKQYEPIEVVEFSKSHDRFLIIDETEVYHIGASLKDLGKKWFAFSKLNIDAKELLGKL
ncbi:MAG: DNA-binding protein [Flavobacteriales bacterium CG03_land_8_20_14_0_80_35_15]|nr:MAG: DNA-binding protein [Flavobacteriales bacterium CG03_land_8_20_14_0_80_35_15]